MVARVQGGRGSAVKRAGRPLRYVIPYMHVPERDVVVARGRDLFGGNRRRPLHVAIFHEESVCQRDIPPVWLWGRNSGQGTVVGRMLHHRTAPDPSSELGQLNQAPLRLENQMQIFGQRGRRERGINRSFV